MPFYLHALVFYFCDSDRCVSMGRCFREDDDQGLLIFSNGDMVTFTCMTVLSLLVIQSDSTVNNFFFGFCLH